MIHQKSRSKNTIKNVSRFFIILCFVFTVSIANGQLIDCSAKLENDTLLIRNNKIERKWLWNKGELKAWSMTNVSTGRILYFESSTPSFGINENAFQKNKEFEILVVEKNIFAPAHLEVVVENEYESSIIKHVFKVYPETPAISCEYFMKYSTLFQESKESLKQVDGTEKSLNSEEKIGNSFLDYYPLQSRHWRVKTVEFKDATDVNDNLVFEREMIPYRRAEKISGNLLFANDLTNGNNFFILKEAPNGKSQINYPDYDFLVSNKEIKIAFSGFPFETPGDDWVKGYSITTGVSGEQKDCLLSLRTYLKNSLNYDPKQFDMVMMNTWGDRGQDGKISEEFILKELTEAKKLGISHFQIDDGWQQGLSSNSVYKTENLWDAWSPESWMPHKERFPNGLDRIIQSAKEKEIKLGLWFNPSKQNSYENWEADANVIINLYRTTGIKYFKIDGVAVNDKLAEINLTKFFDTVKNASNGEVLFNLDLTAGVRGGYFSFRPYGNLFLENRYTDWANYYPFHTLRNLWMLSKYFPAELLQVEFLNKWRNPDKYVAGDPFAPSNYSFDYVFAISMAAQPLAWFEGTGLPEDAFSTSATIKKYREIQSDFHSGFIFPIGEEPSGSSWTGFQSIQKDRGYILIFRENSTENSAQIKTFLPSNSKVKLNLILGKGNQKETEVAVTSKGKMEFSLPVVNSFALYEYRIVGK